MQLREELFAAADQSAEYVVWKANHGCKHPSHYELPFSLVVPGDLHASVNTSLGVISYELRVTIQTAGFGINAWTESLRVPVYRIPDQAALHPALLADTLSLRGDWLGAVGFQLQSDAATVADNSTVRARIVVRPLQGGLRLATVGLRLVETFRFKAVADRLGHARTHDRVACQVQQATSDVAASGLPALPLTSERCFDLELNVPRAFAGIQYSMDTPELRVLHELMLTATIIDSHQEPRYLRISAPLRVVPKLALDAEFAELPDYHRSALDRLLLGGAGLLPGYCAPHQSPPPSYQAC
ncbi:hypothetical protein H4R19_004440 [Coemansia spiralis]|nr:hypothetical protein H4R19_004440 [Coemansia spiralis]